ncbi:MAG: HAMP domain-containing sensor histidine kinase [Candidatus Paceibacterota bacterium]|jgi:signal transduction histidine kinase
METSIQTFIDMCQWDTSRFLIFSNNVFGTLIYYSHFLALILALVVGLFVLLKGKNQLVNRLLSLIMFLFSLWVFFDLILWANEKDYFIMFFWSAMLIIEPLIYALCVYFIDVFIEKKDISFKKKIGVFSLLLPIIVLLPTQFSLVDFNLTNCFREPTEGLIATYYVYFVEIIYTVWILIFAIKKYRKSVPSVRRQIILITLGIILFLLSFVSGNIVGSFTENWTLAQVGLFSMPIFVVFLAYMIVKFKTFNIKMLGAQALVFALGFSVLGITFIRNIDNIRAVAIATLLLVVVVGYLLIRGVKKEIEAKENERLLHEKFEELAGRFENVNHILAHDIKNTLGKNRDIFVETLAGTFGEITEQGKSFFKRLNMDTGSLIASVTNILKSGGKIEPNVQPFDLKEAVLGAVVSVKDKADAEKIKIETQIDEKENYMVTADRSLIVPHVLNNLIENAINYNVQNGSVFINLSKKDPNTILLAIKDTGWGMTEEDKKNLFKPGGHGPDSIKKNVHTSGFGLSIAKETIDAHKGKVYGTSEGRNKGSTFFVELPVNFTGTQSAIPGK